MGAAAHFLADRFNRQHILGTSWVLNFDVPSAWRLIGAILTFLPCNVLSNLSLYKDMSDFPGRLSATYLNGMSTQVKVKSCEILVGYYRYQDRVELFMNY